MKCLMEIKQGALSFDTEISLASLLGFRKIIYTKGRYKSQSKSQPKDRIEYIEFHIKDEHGRPIDFNGDVLSLTLHLC